MRGISVLGSCLLGSMVLILACGSSTPDTGEAPQSIAQTDAGTSAVDAAPAPERDPKLTGEWWRPDGTDGGASACRSRSGYWMWSFDAAGNAIEDSDPSVDGGRTTGTFTTHDGVLSFAYVSDFGATRGTTQVTTQPYRVDGDTLVIGEMSFVRQDCGGR